MIMRGLLENVVDKGLNYGREQLEDIFRHRVAPPTMALDIGLGDCCDLLALRRIHPGAQLYGVDFRQQKLDAAREHGISPYGLDLETAALPFADESMELIIANQVFEHLKNVVWCVHECCRVLRQGGSLVVGVPNLASLHNRLLLLFGRQPTSIKTISAHVRGFTSGELASVVVEVGSGALVRTHACGANFYPLPGWSAKIMARLLPGLAVSTFQVFRKSGPYDAALFNGLGQRNLETLFTDPG